jgi:hypothetical protein
MGGSNRYTQADVAECLIMKHRSDFTSVCSQG